MSLQSMKPVVVMPMYDPAGLLFPHLINLTPTLRSLFEYAIVSIPPATADSLTADAVSLLKDEFFIVLHLEEDMPVGLEFATLYSFAVEIARQDWVLHLCYIDRVAYALQSEHRHAFINDVQSLAYAEMPLIFERSQSAWRSHPNNYIEMEQFVTRIGELLLGYTLDFGWCHLVVTPKQLKVALADVSHTGISMVAEMLIPLCPHITMRPVDWLAWEDPFIFERDPNEMRSEREASIVETNKRLNYVIPMLQLLQEKAEQ